MYENLKFSRQFLLTRSAITPLADWKCLQINQYYLYAHPELEINQAADAKKGLVLIGSLFDSENPEKGNDNILLDILTSTNNLDEVVIWIKRYAGSYALLYQDDKDTFIQHDALGLREIYYCTKDNRVVCGSQPNIITEFADPEIKPTSDPDLLDFYENHLKNYSWIGDETYYEGVKHLLPNHRLNISIRESCRYWPNEPLKRLELNEAVSRSCSFLQGIIKAMEHRHPIMMAVTAGTDSRTLLAASRGIQDRIYYFINNEGIGHHHPDISTPINIFKSIGVPFHVHDVPKDVDKEFRRIFLSNVFLASERILPTIYNIYYKNHRDKVNILGTGEIGRTRFGKDPKNLNAYSIAYKLGYSENRYAFRQSEQILTELIPVGKKFGMNVLSLVHWEQNKGNRWVVGNSESDIAIEEVDPFASHLLIELFWGVNEKYTKNQNNILFDRMIHRMWPELLKWPINPPHTILGYIKWLLGKMGMFEFVDELRYELNYVRYRYKTRR